MFKLVLEKAEEPEIIEKAREFQKNFCFTDYAREAYGVTNSRT